MCRAAVGLLLLGCFAAESLSANPPAPTQLPTGGKVVAGTAKVSQSGTTMNVNQSSQRSAIDWNTFNLGSQATVNFNQPSTSSVTLNRVLDSDPSQIFGKINANGQIFFTNPNGIYFGAGSSVDVGGLTATTGSISNSDFMSGNYRFSNDGATGSIVNAGNLKAHLGGYIALLAPEVRNKGIVVAQMGTVALAAGDAYELQFESNNTLANIIVKPATIKALVENGNAVEAPGGRIILSATAVDKLQGGVVNNSGRIEATSLTDKGGVIRLEGDSVNLDSGSSIDASGATGGGKVLVGGDWKGAGDMRQAKTVKVASGATIKANATASGNGGTVVVRSDANNPDSTTTIDGSVQALGAGGGKGGKIETSGHNLGILGTINAGSGGDWLLDPHNITVDTSGSAALTDVSTYSTNPSTDSTISPDTITTATNAGTAVTLQASNDITVNSAIVSNNTGGNGGNLTFQAGRSITLNANITSDDGNITMTANDGTLTSDTNRDSGTAVFQNNSLIDAGSGDVSIGMGNFAATSGTIETGQVTANNLTVTQNGPTAGVTAGAIDLGETQLDGNLTITANSDRNVTNVVGSIVVRGTNSNISVGAGDVTINRPTTDFNVLSLTAGNVTLEDANAMRFGTVNLSGNLSQTTVGPIASTGSVQVAGTTDLTATYGGFGYADPYISLTNSGNHFGGNLSLNINSNGGSGTGGYADITDSGAVTLGTVNLSSSLSLTAGGNVNLGSTTTGSSATVNASGAIDLGTTSVGTDLTASTSGNGAITQTGALTVPHQTQLTAGSSNDITLNNTGNDFGSVRIISGKNVTLVDKNAINLGSYYSQGGYTSTISGNLDVTAAGDISQTAYGSNNGGYSAISVAGTTTLTTTASSPVNLYLGPSDPFNYSGQPNDFAGGVTLVRTDTTNGGFSNVQLRNTDSTASVISGLTNVGTLNNVYFRFDNAPSVTLPGMTVTGNLKIQAPSVANTATTPTNKITQSGAIVVGGSTIVDAASTGDIVLDNVGNNFNQFGVANTGARNITLVDSNGVVLYTPGYHQYITGDYNVTAGGDITDVANRLWVTGNATMNAGSHNISFTGTDFRVGSLAVPAANNVTVRAYNNLNLDNINITGALDLYSQTGGSLTQSASTSVVTGSPSTNTTTLNNFYNGITLSNSDNVLGNLAISNSGNLNIRENDPITQASAWSFNGTNGGTNSTRRSVTLTTSNDQAITLDQANTFGDLTITQINSGSTSPGAVYVRETGDSYFGMTQGGAWTVHGTTKIDGGSYSINLDNPNNVFGPLQVLGASGLTNSQASTVTIYAKNSGSNPAITDVGGTGAWTAGTGSGASVRLVGFDSTGTTAGAGNIDLENTGNVLGDLYIKGNNVTITENHNITDGPSVVWDSSAGSDTGWVTTGNTNLVVANPTGKSITLDNITNQLGPLSLTTTGTAGTLSSVLITDNTDLTQGSVWDVGAAPVTLNATNHAIDLSSSGNVLGDVSITTTNGTPTSLSLTENDPITQGGDWVLTGVPVTLDAQNGKSITLTNAANIFGNLTVTGGTTSITENGNITQGGAWTTTGNTTLNPTAHAVTLTNAGNVLGPLAFGGTPSAVTITENDDITQAAAWSDSGTPFTLNAGTHDILLSKPTNALGDLTLTAQNATVTEADAAGITDAGAWTIPGTTTLTAGAANPIVLDANPASDFGTVSIVSASNADIADANGIIFGNSTIASGGTLTVTAGGPITQTGTITAPSLRLIGTGSADLPNAGNNVSNLAAGFSGGDLTFTNSGDFAVAVVGGTSGVTISAHKVKLTSVNGTITGLSNINASTSSLDLTTGTGLTVPQMSIAGPQSYTASTVSGSGITLTAGVTSTAAGAITFNSPVTLSADLPIQSSNSDIIFNSTIAGGTNQLTVNAGTGLATFTDAVSGLGNTGDAGPALSLTSSGATFDSTLDANNGLAVTGPVTFKDNVTLGDGGAASVFTGLVTLGKVGGMNLSGYAGMTFRDGVLLQNGPATINSNNSPLTFETAGSVSGPYDLTLNSGTQTLTGLDRMGTDLTSLTVTALNPTIPSGGVSISGPQSYTATSNSSITLNGDVTSTAAGTITFNSPVTVGVASKVKSSDSNIDFASTVDGNKNLTVDAGSGATSFDDVVGGIAPLGSGTGAALALQGSGTTTFHKALKARSGITAVGPVVFDGDVTLGNGDTGSTFGGLVTTGGSAGNTVNGYDGIAFNGGLMVVGGPVDIISNGGTLSLGGPVGGTQALTLDSLSGGAGTVTGLDQIGNTSTLSGLTVTGQTLSLPSTGLAVAGPMSFTAPGGITVNGSVGSSSGPATGQIDFNSPVTLATGAIAVTSGNGDINFNSTVDGGEALTVTPGAGAATFADSVGATTPLASIATSGGNGTVLSGGSIHTTGAQTYNNGVTLGNDATLTGVNVSFNSTVDGAHALAVNDSGTTVFGDKVGNNNALTSITTDAPGSVSVNGGSVKTSGSQTYNDNLAFGGDTTFTGNGLAFNGLVDGSHVLSADAGSGALSFAKAVGSSNAPTSLDAKGNTVAAGPVTTSGSQNYTATGGITLDGDLTTTASPVTVTGPTTLGSDLTVSTGGGNIDFSGSTSSINGAHTLALTAGSGDVTLGGVVGGITPLTGLTVSGNNLTLPGITTVGDLNQSYTALNNITLNQSRTLNAPISFTADSDNSGSGSFILLNGVSLTASNNTLTIKAADLDLQGNSTLSSGTGQMSIIASGDRNIALGGTDAAGQMTITGNELSRISTSGGLDLKTTGAGWIHVNGITSAQSQNITGTLALNAQGTGDIGFITSPSTFNAVTANAAGGNINVGVNLTANNNAITFATPVTVSGASTINSGGGNIAFQNTVAVDNDLTLTTGNGSLSFAGAVGSNKTLTLNLGGGSVSGLDQLQNTLTGLTVNANSAITLPALAISGPQVYNTGKITVTGDLSGTGIAFNNLVDIQPASGSAIALNAGTGTLAFNDLASFNANDMTLTGDEINFSRTVTGTGSLVLQPYTGSTNVAVGGTGTPISGLNLTAAELADLPLSTISGLTIGSASGTGTLALDGTVDVAGTPLTLNGGGGISQSGGYVGSGDLTLYSAGNGISLNSATNKFGAVGLTGTPTSLALTNTADISQLGTSAWTLGTGAVDLNAGTHNITVTNAGNTFGTVTLTGNSASVSEAADTDLGASNLTGNLQVTSSGMVTQSGALTVGGNLDVSTTANLGDVSIDNSGALSTTIGDTYVGGNYSITATGKSISQAAGSTLQVRGNLSADGSNIVLGGAGNLVGGTTSFTGGSASTTQVIQAGVITLGNRTESGNLTVISERTNRSFGSAQVSGTAINLTNSSNNIGGTISVTASKPTIVTGSDVQTGIKQTAGTSLSVAGVASFTAEASSAGSLGIDLSNAGNSFGDLQVSGNTVNVKNSSTGTTTLGNSDATTSFTLNAAGKVAQTGPVTTPDLSITTTGSVVLKDAANDVGSLSVDSGGNAIDYVDSNDLAIASLNAGGADVSLKAGGTGNLTQTGALQNVGALTADAGGAVTLTNTGNTIGSLAGANAGTGLQLFDSAGGLSVTGAVQTASGDLQVRTSGDLTLASGGSLQAAAGNVIASTEGAGNFINNATAGASALSVGAGKRWLVYSDTPDLVSGAHTVKGGLTSDFRHYGATFTSYQPGSVTESGNGFIYNYAKPSLTLGATIVGTPSQVYGEDPTATLGYKITGGLVDSEDSLSNVITGGTATYSQALSKTMDAGTYSIKYTGGLTSNYTIVPDTTGATYKVTPAVLTYNATAASRSYGAANPALTGTVTGFKLGQNASILTGTPSWTTTAVATSNVGQYAINGSGYSAGSNYTFAQASGNATALSVTPADLTVTAKNDSKTYDGTAYSGGNGVTFGAFANGEDSSVLGGTLSYAGDSQGAVNAGSYSITPSGLSSANYNIHYVSGTLNVDPATLTLTPNAITKTYDGTLGATGTATVANGTKLFGSDSLSGGTFAFNDANAGTGKTVTLSGVTINDGNGGNNYTVNYVNSTSGTINPAAITVSSSDVTKTYDGTLAASGHATVVSGTLYHNASNGGTLDSLSGGNFAFTDPNAGTGKTVTVDGVSVNDGNGGANYDVTYADNTTSTINKAPLTFSGTIATKTYDGTADATLVGYTLNGLVGDETVHVKSGAATFADKNAGTGKSVAISGLYLTDGSNGGLASNYSIDPTSTSTGTIQPKELTLTADVASKTYDGTTAATLNGFNLSGFVGSETVGSVYTGTASFSDKNVGTNKAVTITGVTLVNGTNGGLASNYSISSNAVSNADITPATLHIAGVFAADKVYDGTTAANLITKASTLTGVIGSDDVAVSSITGTYQDKNVGADKPITASTAVLSGADAGNYTLVQPTGLASSITPRPLSVTASGVDKVYDGTTTATVDLSDDRISGDSLSIDASAAFLDKNVGVGKHIDVSGITLTGADAANYTVNGTTSTYAAITPATTTKVTGFSAANKVYDGTVNATLSTGNLEFTGLVAGDSLTATATGATFDNKNVGNGKTVSIQGITLQGADAGNYRIITTAATTTANITPATITAITGFGAADKAYDGTDKATFTTGSLGFTGMVAGDDLTATASSATFADKNVGSNKTVTIKGLSLAGSDASNYVLSAATSATTTATITPALLTVSTSPVTKTYDGTTSADGSLLVTAGQLYGTDTLTGGAFAFTDKNAGTGKTVVVSNVAVNDGNKGANYIVSYASNTDSVIDPATLDVTANDDSKNFDGFAYQGGNGVTYNGFVDGEGKSVLGGSLTYSGSSQGAVQAGVYTITPGGLTSGNYNLVYVNGTLTIDPATSTQTISDKEPPLPPSPQVKLPSSASTGVTFSGNPGSTGGNSGSNAANGGAGSANVIVSPIREPAGDNAGIIMVSVPSDMVSTGKGFSFSLPALLAAEASSAPVHVTTNSGDPLPRWIRYVPSTRTIVVSSVPNGSFPIRLLVTVGAKKVMVVISQSVNS